MLTFGVDVGGTFTDVVVFDEDTGEIRVAKVPSTPANQAEGFRDGLRALDVDLPRVSRGLHGTTVATNAAIERKGAPTVGVFTKGFRGRVGHRHRPALYGWTIRSAVSQGTPADPPIVAF